MPAAFLFSAAENEVIAETRFPRYRRERSVSYEMRAQAAEIAFSGLGPALINGLGDHEIENGVAEILQPFVAEPRRAAMGQCPREQIDVPEFVLQKRLEPAFNCLHASLSEPKSSRTVAGIALGRKTPPPYRRTFARLSKSTTNEMLAMNGVLWLYCACSSKPPSTATTLMSLEFICDTHPCRRTRIERRSRRSLP